ncbi:MAG: ABC transporter ATP-binding protein, partial [Burkholderiaceae bacterium]|nr:ABC transporter ATP-binding protein [Burkholderiaceae bacterium]
MTATQAPAQAKTPARFKPGWNRRAALYAFWVLTACAPFLVGAAGGNYWVRVLDFALLYIMLALGLNIVV